LELAQQKRKEYAGIIKEVFLLPYRIQNDWRNYQNGLLTLCKSHHDQTEIAFKEIRLVLSRHGNR
jgi:hypothetical protein